MSLSSFTAHLDEGIVSQTGACKSGCGPQESRVCHLFYRLSTGEDKSRIGERDDNVGIILIWGEGGGGGERGKGKEKREGEERRGREVEKGGGERRREGERGRERERTMILVSSFKENSTHTEEGEGGITISIFSLWICKRSKMVVTL